MTKPTISLQELRTRIGHRAKSAPTHRFWGLYVHLTKIDTLEAAYLEAKRNSGAPGADGVTFESIEEAGRGGFLAGLAKELRKESYRPGPYRRREIPKEGGKVRVISIPSIRDRVVQGALRLILEPIFEADFSKHSYGARPGRSAHEAIEEVRRGLLRQPPECFPRSLAAPSLLAHVLTDKFCDGLPLHRIEKRLARDGFPLDRGTMSRWVEDAGATAGATVIAAAREEAWRTAFCIATDATGIPVQPEPREDGKRQACHRGHYFVQIADRDHVFFEYARKETSATLLEMFEGYAGYIQADAKSVYDVLFREPDKPPDDDEGDTRIEVGCWSHYPENAVIPSGGVGSRRVAVMDAIVMEGALDNGDGYREARNARVFEVGRHSG